MAMCDHDSRPGPKPRPPLCEKDIEGLKYFKLIQGLLGSLHAHKACANRKLHYDQLASLVILHFFNPTLGSLRAMQQASGLRKVQKQLGVKRASLGSLSEASRVFDPALLRGVAEELGAQVAEVDASDRPPGWPEDLSVVAVDGTLLDALPRMTWALWQNEENRAAKLHLEFDILRAAPRALAVTDANANERHALRDALQPGRLYVLDAGYGEYKLFEEIRQAGSSLVARLHDNAAYETLEEREPTEADRRADVVFDRVVRLGSKAKRDDIPTPVRVVLVHAQSPPERGLARRKSRVSSKKTFRHRPQEYDILLVTDQMDLPAETIALMYRNRWAIELFFRWLKCVLRFQHLVFESRQGLEIMVYCALIASLLISLWTGRKPTKRTLEMVQLYFQGWAELDELEAHIASLKPIAN